MAGWYIGTFKWFAKTRAELLLDFLDIIVNRFFLEPSQPENDSKETLSTYTFFLFILSIFLARRTKS